MRTSGILLHITSLPSPYGIGTLGKEAYRFAEFLHIAGQRYWQMLPTGPTSFGDSPYQSFSAFAGNPYFIDLDMLVSDGLLTEQEVEEPFWGDDPAQVDYSAVYEARLPLLRKAFARGYERDQGLLKDFEAEQAFWLPDYALFMALKSRFGMRAWTEWPEDIRLREEKALTDYRDMLQEETRFHSYVQFLFFRQWKALKEHCAALNLLLIGDLPIYVALDSADVWANPELFLLDEARRPTHVAGVPPDYFSSDGQLWGNPLYDWDSMKQDGFAWWMRRIAASAGLFDVIRIDHFRGLSSYWSVPFYESTAKNGRWKKGPGRAFIDSLKRNFPALPIIAEDLGILTQDVYDLMEYAGYPGMRVLQFAFDALAEHHYQPHTYPVSCVCYTGTHDNDTVMGWLKNGDPEAVGYAAEYFGLNAFEGLNWGFLRGGMSSAAELFIAQMQDYLGLDSSARMNTPSTTGNNWRWRMLPDMASDALAEKIRHMTKMYGRCK